MFENLSSSEWLLYISEWQHQDQNVSSNISNIRVTTKVAVHSLLSNSEDLQIRGAAIIHNLACKEVKTVVCILPVQLTFSSFADFCFHFHNSLLKRVAYRRRIFLSKIIILQFFKLLSYDLSLHHIVALCVVNFTYFTSLEQDCRKRDMNRNCLTLKHDPSMHDIICNTAFGTRACRCHKKTSSHCVLKKKCCLYYI